MLQFAQTLINYVVAHWPELSALVGGGAGLSVALEFVLHKLRIDSKKLAYSLLHLLSLAGALSAFYVDSANVLPTYAGLAIAAQTVHRFVVSPWYTRYVQPYLTYLSEQAPATAGQPQVPAAGQTAAPSFFVS